MPAGIDTREPIPQHKKTESYFIRKAGVDDMPGLLELYAEARKFMAESGNPDQWKNGYPDKNILLHDISLGRSFVCLCGTAIAAGFCFFYGEEPAYRTIYNGKWQNEATYGVIHRIAASGLRRGAASFCMEWCETQCKNLRIDTHQNNLPMQNLLKKQGFAYCGIIILPDGSSRMAYQRSFL
jgi:hypothetical protein